MTDIPTVEPLEWAAGDTVQWTKDLADYPAGTWTLAYYFRGAAGGLAATATASGTTHAITITAAQSAVLAPGRYAWEAYVTSGSVRHRVGGGTVLVTRNLAATPAGFDARQHCEKVLDAIEAVIEGRATRDQQSYSIAGRSLQRMPVADLIVLRDKYKFEVAELRRAERIAQGLGTKSRILVRFGAPT